MAYEQINFFSLLVDVENCSEKTKDYPTFCPRHCFLLTFSSLSNLNHSHFSYCLCAYLILQSFPSLYVSPEFQTLVSDMTFLDNPSVPGTWHLQMWIHYIPPGVSQVALVVKNLPANAGDIRDVGLIPGSGRSPRGGHGNPLHYSCLKNPMDRGAWWAAVHMVTRSRTWLKRPGMHAHIFRPSLLPSPDHLVSI